MSQPDRRATLLALADRVEREGPSREVDCEIHFVIGLEPFRYGAPRYTASLDDAASLFPAGWRWRIEPRFFTDDERVEWKAYGLRPRWQAWTPDDADWIDMVTATVRRDDPVPALTAACLRALAEGGEQ